MKRKKPIVCANGLWALEDGDYSMFTKQGNREVHKAVKQFLKALTVIEKTHGEVQDTMVRDSILAAVREELRCGHWG